MLPGVGQSHKRSAGHIDRRVVQLRLGAYDQAVGAGKLEIGDASTQVNLADQLARGVPDVHAVAAASVDVALGVGVNTWCKTPLASRSSFEPPFIPTEQQQQVRGEEG